MLPVGTFFAELARRGLTGVLHDGGSEIDLHDM